MRKAKFLFFLSVLVLTLVIPLPSRCCPIIPDGESNNVRWAEPIAIDGVPNLYCFGPGLYRGAQPGPNGFEKLQKLGIKTVINLRSFHSNKEAVRKLGISYEQIHMKAWQAEKEDVVQFLRIAADPSRLPIFVHCHHGSDRTGLVVAAYRVVVTGWTKEEAIQEMIEGGYGFHPIWGNLVRFIRNLEVKVIREETGIMDRMPGAFGSRPQISPSLN